MTLMTQIIISSIGTVAFLGVIVSLYNLCNELFSTYDDPGVACHTCMGTGLDISRSFIATPCKYGCAENHASPYWDLAQAMR